MSANISTHLWTACRQMIFSYNLLFATILSRTEPTERFLDAALVVVDNVLFDRRLKLLVAMVDAPIVIKSPKKFSITLLSRQFPLRDML